MFDVDYRFRDIHHQARAFQPILLPIIRRLWVLTRHERFSHSSRETPLPGTRTTISALIDDVQVDFLETRLNGVKRRRCDQRR